MKILAHLKNLADELRDDDEDEVADFIERRAQDMQIIKFKNKKAIEDKLSSDDLEN